MDSTSQGNSPDGSENNPFASLNQAIAFLKSGEFQVLLKGRDLLIDSPVIIPPGSNYHIE